MQVYSKLLQMSTYILDTAKDHVVNIQPADVQMINTAQGDVDRVQFPPATVAVIGIH